MKKRAPLVLVTALASVAAIGCGSDEEEKAQAPPPTSVVIEQTGGKKDAKLRRPPR